MIRTPIIQQSAGRRGTAVHHQGQPPANPIRPGIPSGRHQGGRDKHILYVESPESMAGEKGGGADRCEPTLKLSAPNRNWGGGCRGPSETNYGPARHTIGAAVFQNPWEGGGGGRRIQGAARPPPPHCLQTPTHATNMPSHTAPRGQNGAPHRGRIRRTSNHDTA